jgi:FtsZ-interacting cell division protein YlmF
MGPSPLSHPQSIPAQRTRPAAGGPELVVLAARGMDDGRTLIRAVRRGASVLLDTRGLDQPRGQRLVDFCSGGVMAMDGQALRAGENAFLFAPALARITAP